GEVISAEGIGNAPVVEGDVRTGAGAAANAPVLASRAISFQARGIPQLLEQLGPAVKCGERTPADVTGDQGEKRRRVHVSYVRDEYDAVALAQTELGGL